MTTLIGNLRLHFLLRMTLVLLRRALRRSERVRQLMRQDSFVFQIRTDAGSGGYFVVRDGAIALRFGVHPRPDFVQSWNNGHDAFRTLTSNDETDLLRAFEARQYRMQGNFLRALWFNEVMKLARNKEPAYAAR